jgi:hypothetical protein
MRLRVMLTAVGGAVVVGVGVAFAAHAPEIVPTGFFVAHNHVADVFRCSRSRGRWSRTARTCSSST